MIKIEIIINGLYSLYLPAEGIDITLIRNEFNLLTNNVAANRPLYVTETFKVPLEENRRIFEELKGEKKICQLLYNNTVMISGALFEYSVDEQRKEVLVTITSQFKDMVDFMGDNVLYLDKIDLGLYNYIVSEFSSIHDTDLLKFGYYNPMNTDTGYIEFNQSNINDYCKPSLNLWAYFKQIFDINGWGADWDLWTAKMQQVCLLPTEAYQCSSWSFSAPGIMTIAAGEEIRMPLTSKTNKWNIVSAGVFGVDIQPNNQIQVRQPNRLMRFKIKALYDSTDPFNVIIRDGAKEMAFIQSLGDNSISYTTDSINLKEGIDPLSVSIQNTNPYDITIDFGTLEFYNLFSIYETNQDDFLPPQGYVYSVPDNYPKITPLELYQQTLTLFQMAQTSDDVMQNVSYYFINDIPAKFDKIDVKPYLFWDGYTILSDKISGLAKLNAIRYKGDQKKQRYFRANLAPLPSNGVYFESLFAHGETNNGWEAVQIPSLQYKVKTVEDIPVEYLEYSEVPPQLGYYEANIGRMIFQPLHITTIVSEYWSNFLTFLSSFDGHNPVVYKLKLRITYYQYLTKFQQCNLFEYQSDSLLLEAEYDVINQTFTGTFISLR